MDRPLPHPPPAEDLQMIEFVLFGDRRQLAARGFELEESPGELRTSRTLTFPEVLNDERTIREGSLKP